MPICSSDSSPTAFGYTGQRADAATGLDYYHARYYDPVAQQFASADTVSVGLSRYAYTGGNPTTMVDPSGHRRCNPSDPSQCGPPPGGGKISQGSDNNNNSNVELTRYFLRPLLERTGLPRIRFHDLRHTAATLLLEHGVDLKLVSSQLGHSSITVTGDIYTHVTDRMRRMTADTMSQLLKLPDNQ